MIAYTNRSNDTVERLPDPEWDRMQALEDRIVELERRLADAQARLDAREGVPTADR